MDISKVRWSSAEYSLQEYVSTFSDSFPGIIKITEGFLGKQEIDSLSSSTVVRVHSLYKQKRVAAEHKAGKIFSLPFHLKSLQFLLVQNAAVTKVSKMQDFMTLEEILSRYSTPVTVLSSKVLSFKEKGDLKSQDEMLSELTIFDTYEESFLLGHPIDKGKLLIQEPIMIPMYMAELKLVLAEGYTDGNKLSWKKICKEFEKQIAAKGNVAEITIEEIFLLDKHDLSQQEPSYSSIEPIYLDISEIQKHGKVQVGNKSMVNLDSKQNVQEVDSNSVKNMYEPSHKEQQTTTQFTGIIDIPLDLHGLNVKQVCECLVMLNMKQYVDAFYMAQVDGQLLYDLDHDMMINCLGMHKLNAIKLLKFRNGWRPMLPW